MKYKLYTLEEVFLKEVSDRLPYNFTGIAEWPYGIKQWYINGKLHRIDGPAVEQNSGTLVWWTENKLHRIGGPAIESYNEFEYWYVDDKEVTKEEHDLLYSIMKLKGLVQ